MQLPLPSAHRYHNVGLPLEVPLKTTDSKHGYNEDKGDALGRYETSSYIDSRVLAKIQHIVRQGFVNPFLVRAAAKVSFFYEPC